MATARNRTSQYGFFPAAGTNYTYGQEPQVAARLNRLAKALKLHLIGISGYRSPQHSVAVGGFSNDPHTRGQASDTPGIEGVSESVLRRFGLTRPFPGAQEADHIQLLGGAKGTTTARGRNTGVNSLGSWWIQGGGPKNLAPIMAAIGMAESGGRVDAIGGPNSDGSYDYGWLQINSSHGYNKAKLLSDPIYTARAGVAIWRSQGLGAWSTYKSGAYKTYLGGKNVGTKAPRTRPGGQQDDSDAAINAIFADYVQSGQVDASNPDDVRFGFKQFLHPFDPIGKVFSGPLGAVKDVGSFLKWIAWIFSPLNILRVVEFTTGLTIMGIGLHTAVEFHRNAPSEPAIKRTAKKIVAATPPGRAARLATARRSGRESARVQVRVEENRAEFRRARTREREKQKHKRGARNTKNKYGNKPPF